MDKINNYYIFTITNMQLFGQTVSSFWPTITICMNNYTLYFFVILIESNLHNIDYFCNILLQPTQPKLLDILINSMRRVLNLKGTTHKYGSYSFRMSFDNNNIS
jgi:hypothetical protein